MIERAEEVDDVELAWLPRAQPDLDAFAGAAEAFMGAQARFAAVSARTVGWGERGTQLSQAGTALLALLGSRSTFPVSPHQAAAVLSELVLAATAALVRLREAELLFLPPSPEAVAAWERASLELEARLRGFQSAAHMEA